jgi:hypothetical protein
MFVDDLALIVEQNESGAATESLDEGCPRRKFGEEDFGRQIDSSLDDLSRYDNPRLAVLSAEERRP